MRSRFPPAHFTNGVAMRSVLSLPGSLSVSATATERNLLPVTDGDRGLGSRSILEAANCRMWRRAASVAAKLGDFLASTAQQS